MRTSGVFTQRRSYQAAGERKARKPERERELVVCRMKCEAKAGGAHVYSAADGKDEEVRFFGIRLSGAAGQERQSVRGSRTTGASLGSVVRGGGARALSRALLHATQGSSAEQDRAGRI